MMWLKRAAITIFMGMTLPYAVAAQYVPVNANANVNVFPATQQNDNILSEAERCERLFPRYERLMSLPIYMLRAISLTESGRFHQQSNRLVPWPWAVHAENRAYYADSREEAAAIVRKLQAGGVQNIDVGCMQINLMYHGQAFRSVEDALEPVNNVAYAAKYLQDNFKRTSSWKQAVSDYHSATPSLGEPYAVNVLRNWNQSMSDALARGRIEYNRNSGDIFENSQVSGWDGVERYAMPATPMPEWYYPQDDSGGPYSGLATDPAKLRRVMQKNPSDVIFVRVDHPNEGQASAAPSGQEVVYQKGQTQPQTANVVPVQPPQNVQPNAVPVQQAVAQPNATIAVPQQQPLEQYNAYAPAAGYQPQAPSAARTDVSQTATTITIDKPPVVLRPQPQQQASGGAVAGYSNGSGQAQLARQPGQPYMVFGNGY